MKNDAAICKQCGESLQLYLERGFPYEDGLCPVCVSKNLLNQMNPENRKIFLKEMEEKRAAWINALLS